MALSVKLKEPVKKIVKVKIADFTRTTVVIESHADGGLF